MNRITTTALLPAAALALLLPQGHSRAPDSVPSPAAGHGVEAPLPEGPSTETFQVRGTGVHYFSTAIPHARMQEETGETLRTTEIIRLEGDLNGYVLYQPVTRIDYATSTLENTGTQVFSGTVGDSDPVLLHDDTFRFEVDLDTGATVGRVHLRRSQDAPHAEYWYECDLEVTGTGRTPEGDATAAYTGSCTRFGAPPAAGRD